MADEGIAALKEERSLVQSRVHHPLSLPTAQNPVVKKVAYTLYSLYPIKPNMVRRAVDDLLVRPSELRLHSYSHSMATKYLMCRRGMKPRVRVDHTTLTPGTWYS